jgi:hypothetical protein
MVENPNPKDILFLCEYSNVAWGLEYDGIFITRGGRMYRFGKKAGTSQRPSEADQSRADYIAWVSEHAVFESQVDLAELDKKARLIEAASKGEIVPGDWGFDAGTTFYLAFRLKGEQAEEIVLEIFGDASTAGQPLNNQSPEAAELVNWLNEMWINRW